jgi:rhodanese-related sulfurtransferase
MKKLATALSVLLALWGSQSHADDLTLQDYLLSFDYEARVEMKASPQELVQLLKQDKAQLIDIRFKEEFEAWHMGSAINIPLNELPKRLNEIDKNKIIVTACPHKDRAIIAMVFLKTKGFHAKYLKDGLISMAELLRGDKAKEFIQK